MGRRRHYSGGSGCGFRAGSIIGSIVAMIVLGIIVLAVVKTSNCVCSGSGNGNQSYSGNSQAVSHVSREKIDNPVAFDSNCVVDQLNWIENVSSTAKSLESFYKKTGVQPYVVFLKYNSELKTDDQKKDYAEKWYEDHIGNKTSFLFMYFAEKNSDEEVGYMTYIAGSEARKFMDDSAVEIFWNNVDSYWYTDISTDKMVEKIFSSTAEKCL